MQVGLQFFFMRKAYDALLAGFEALWAGLAQAAAAAAAGGGGAQQLTPEPPSAGVAQLQSPQPRERAQKVSKPLAQLLVLLGLRCVCTWQGGTRKS
jgi:hypothetical protein